MATGNTIEPAHLPQRRPADPVPETTVAPTAVPAAPELSEEAAALRAALLETGPLEIITPDVLSRVREGLSDPQPG